MTPAAPRDLDDLLASLPQIDPESMAWHVLEQFARLALELARGRLEQQPSGLDPAAMALRDAAIKGEIRFLKEIQNLPARQHAAVDFAVQNAPFQTAADRAARGRSV